MRPSLAGSFGTLIHEDELGRGANAVVSRVRLGDTAYALKRQHYADAAARVQFRREAALLGSLRHPAFPEVLEVGEAEGRAYILMAEVLGRPLRHDAEELLGAADEALYAAKRAGRDRVPTAAK